MVSLVGRTTSFSSSSFPPPTVTRANSGLKPSTWLASFYERVWYKLWKVHVAVPCLLELNIQVILNSLPNGITVWTNNHGATNGTIIRELSVSNNIEVPRIEVLRPRSDDSVLVNSVLLASHSVVRLSRTRSLALCSESSGKRRPEVELPERSRRPARRRRKKRSERR